MANINLDVVGCLKWVCEETKFIPCAYWNKKKLKKEMEELRRVREELITIINYERQMQRESETQCKVVVSSWLDRVNNKGKEVNGLLDSIQQRRSGCTCCFAASNGRKLLDLIDDIHVLVEERKIFDDDNLVEPIPVDPLYNIKNLSAPMVGRNLKLSEIHAYIKDSQVNTIAIWGPGGIGKTTLLKSIKDGLARNRDLFFHIVWIEMSSQSTVNILDIQKQIAECISLSFQSEDETERARELSKALRHKKSLILIDNVWEKLDFERIGIPSGVGIDNVKIVLTTRDARVCTDMTADPRAQKIVKLDYLDKAESLQLFQNHISSDHVDLKNQIVRQHVDEILKKCGGLPLAIITIASVVKYYTDVAQWDDAVDCLQNSPEDIEGMNDVMRCLKFSYDNLESNEIRSCLLYFSLYPQGSNISTEKLIKEWIGEGFLGISTKNSFKKSYAKGIGFVNKLKSFCLVESGFSGDYDVKVHDLIREMLCWIKKKEKREFFLVYDKDHDDVSNHNMMAKGMYLNERQLKCTLPEEGMPSCPNLTSVIVEANYSHRIVKLPTEDFFCFTPSLRVIDLSYTGLVELPISIDKLVELRHLNLFQTPIKMLPVELGNLKKLEYLDLGDTHSLESIPDVSISQLSKLQFLNLHNTGYRWDSEHCSLTLEDLRELKNLEELGVDVLSNPHLNTILSSQILLKSITSIRFFNVEFNVEDFGQPIKLISERFPPLKILIVEQCALPDKILEIKDVRQLVVQQLCLWNLEILSVVIVKDCTFHSLKYLTISNCQCFKEVSWTTQLPSLIEFSVEKCNGVEELVATEEEEEIEEHKCYFPKLIGLFINDMENLHSIYRRNRLLLFPKLKFLVIQKCPKLKRVSLARDSAKEIQIIHCEQRQWNSLEWEDDRARARFLPYLRVPLQ